MSCSREKGEARVAELEEQVRDLMFFLEAQKTVQENAGEGMEGGAVEVAQKKKRGNLEIDSEWTPEMSPKHRKSLPNGRQQGGAFGAAPRGRRFAPPPWVLLSSIW